FLSNLLCIDMATGHDVQDESPIAMHTVVHCDSSTSNSNAVAYQLVVTNGNGVQTQNTGILPGKSVSTTFTVDTPNMWSVMVTYYDAHGAKLGRELINLQVSFFVLPESPLGVAALTASSIAALGGFMVYKRRKLESA
ncbi:MAG TPA: hypothetical protein VFA15_09950, partial [Nitrososphaera sp.]|nr:hypothetical protein [Nitrososphaera sp.]